MDDLVALCQETSNFVLFEDWRETPQNPMDHDHVPIFFPFNGHQWLKVYSIFNQGVWMRKKGELSQKSVDLSKESAGFNDEDFGFYVHNGDLIRENWH